MKSFDEFVNIHSGKKAVVMGLGESTNQIIGCDLSEFITIGVNDISAVYDAMYVLTVDFPTRFAEGRVDNIKNTRAQYLFTQLPEWDKVPELNGRVVLFKLGGRKLQNVNRFGTLDHSCNSPYMAAILAYQMGCREVGIIGVDFTDNHCHMKDGVHELMKSNRLAEIERDYAELASVMSLNSCSIYNISGASKLQSLPKMDMKKYLGE